MGVIKGHSVPCQVEHQLVPCGTSYVSFLGSDFYFIYFIYLFFLERSPVPSRFRPSASLLY